MSIVWFGEETTAETVGGKGHSLSRMSAAGLPVPPGFCIATAGMEHVEQREIEDGLCRLRADAYAVRSSATQEDAGTTSFAGIYLSRLNITRLQDVLCAIQEVRQSAQTLGAAGYSQRFNLTDSPPVAAVVQTFVPAAAAGVLFTRDPLNGALRYVIEGSWGLAEAVVAGLVRPDRWVLGPHGDTLSTHIGDKDLAIVPREGGGTSQSPVEAARRLLPCLSPTSLTQLFRLGQECECLFGQPQDIEWAVAADRVWILQARPITAQVTSK